METTKELIAQTGHDKLLRLLEVSKAMAFERTLDRLLPFIADNVASTIAADRCGIFLLDKERKEIWSMVATGEKREIRFPVGTGIAGQVIRTGKVLHIPDAYQDERFNPAIDSITGYTTRNILAAPLTTMTGEVIGCFEVVNKIEGDFHPSDETFLLAFGSHAAAAIESAQLHKQNQEMIAKLTAAHQELKNQIRQMQVVLSTEKHLNIARNMQEFMQKAIESAAHACDAAAGSIELYETDAKPARFSYPGDEEGRAGRLDLGEAIAVALQDNDKNIGVLELFKTRSAQFSQEDLAFLHVIGAQITSMIERRRLLDQRELQSRLATIGQLSSSILHDLKNPMAAIKAYAELMMNPKVSDEEKTEFGAIIAGQVDRCVSMTKEVLSFARGDRKYDFKPIDAQELFREIELVLAVETSRLGRHLTVTVEPPPVWVGDAERLKRVIFNLTNNAIEATSKGGRITVSCRGDQDEVEIRVSDDGRGIEEAVRSHLFEAFATSGKEQGTGLGLHIARDIVENHGGTIAVDPTVTNGTCMLIRLPKTAVGPAKK